MTTIAAAASDPATRFQMTKSMTTATMDVADSKTPPPVRRGVRDGASMIHPRATTDATTPAEVRDATAPSLDSPASARSRWFPLIAIGR